MLRACIYDPVFPFFKNFSVLYLEGPIGSEIDERLRFVDFGVAVGTELGSLQVFYYAALTKRMKAFGNDCGVYEVPGAQNAHDMSGGPKVFQNDAWGKKKSITRIARSTPLRSAAHRSAPFRGASRRCTPLRGRRSTPLRSRRS